MIACDPALKPRTRVREAMAGAANQANSRICNRTLERWAQYGICLLALYAGARAVVASISKPLWFDEILTVAVARQPTLGLMWRALRGGVDMQPPLFYLIERAAAKVPNAQIGFRLPSVLGLVCILLCLFLFVRRRTSGINALPAAAVAILTTLYIPYAIEARPYTLAVACVAVALVAYQRASSFRWVVLMALALALGDSLHYYVVFAIVPFVAAEAAFFWRTSKLRPAVWAALVVGGVPFAASWPLLARVKATYGPGFWAQPKLLTLRDFYGDFLNVSFPWGLAAAIVCALVMVVPFASGHWPLLNLWAGESTSELSGDSPFHEAVLIFSLLATPLIVFIAVEIAQGAYTDRYALFGGLGVPLAVGLILPRLGRTTLLLCCSLLACAIAMQEASFFSAPHPLWRLSPPAAFAESVLAASGHPDLPVVIQNAHEYLQLAYYAPEPFARRLVWLADDAAALRYAKNDSNEKGLPRLATCFPLKVYDFQKFSQTHSAFLFYSMQGGSENWLPDELIRYGYKLRVLASTQDHLVVLAERP